MARKKKRRMKNEKKDKYLELQIMVDMTYG